jgi:hypothetical protein
MHDYRDTAAATPHQGMARAQEVPRLYWPEVPQAAAYAANPNSRQVGGGVISSATCRIEKVRATTDAFISRMREINDRLFGPQPPMVAEANGPDKPRCTLEALEYEISRLVDAQNALERQIDRLSQL